MNDIPLHAYHCQWNLHVCFCSMDLKKLLGSRHPTHWISTIKERKFNSFQHHFSFPLFLVHYVLNDTSRLNVVYWKICRLVKYSMGCIVLTYSPAPDDPSPCIGSFPFIHCSMKPRTSSNTSSFWFKLPTSLSCVFNQSMSFLRSTAHCLVVLHLNVNPSPLLPLEPSFSLKRLPLFPFLWLTFPP